MKVIKNCILTMLLVSALNMIHAQESEFQGTWIGERSPIDRSAYKLVITGNSWREFYNNQIEGAGTARFSAGRAELLLADGRISWDLRLLAPGLIEQPLSIGVGYYRFRRTQSASIPQNESTLQSSLLNSATEYIIVCSGSTKGFITVQYTNDMIVITPNITEGDILIDNTICPLIPPSIEIDVHNYSKERVFRIDGNTVTEMHSDGQWIKRVYNDSMIIVTLSEGVWYGDLAADHIIVYNGNTILITYSNGEWIRTIINGNTRTSTYSFGIWQQVVVDGNIITTTHSYGVWNKKTIFRQGNIINIHYESGHN